MTNGDITEYHQTAIKYVQNKIIKQTAKKRKKPWSWNVGFFIEICSNSKSNTFILRLQQDNDICERAMTFHLTNNE